MDRALGQKCQSVELNFWGCKTQIKTLNQNMNLNQTFLVGSVVVHYYNYYNTQLALHYILLGSGEPIKKSNFRHVRSPTVVFAIKPTWARARTCARQLNAMGWHRRRYAYPPSAAWRRHMRW